MKNALRSEHRSGWTQIFPNHEFVKNWLFKHGEEMEAGLAYAMARVAEKNGVSQDELSRIYPLVLRMLKSEIPWAK